jgi:hypothetical protein
MLPAKSTSAQKDFAMFQQKSRALVLLLLVLTWAPIAFAAETSDGVFAELLNQLAEFLGLEMPYNPSPGGLGAPVEEAGPVYVPGGIPVDNSGPNWPPFG